MNACNPKRTQTLGSRNYAYKHGPGRRGVIVSDRPSQYRPSRTPTSDTELGGRQAPACLECLEELAFPHERRPSIEMTSPPPTSSTEGARRTFRAG